MKRVRGFYIFSVIGISLLFSSPSSSMKTVIEFEFGDAHRAIYSSNGSLTFPGPTSLQGDFSHTPDEINCYGVRIKTTLPTMEEIAHQMRQDGIARNIIIKEMEETPDEKCYALLMQFKRKPVDLENMDTLEESIQRLRDLLREVLAFKEQASSVAKTNLPNIQKVLFKALATKFEAQEESLSNTEKISLLRETLNLIRSLEEIPTMISFVQYYLDDNLFSLGVALSNRSDEIEGVDLDKAIDLKREALQLFEQLTTSSKDPRLPGNLTAIKMNLSVALRKKRLTSCLELRIPLLREAYTLAKSAFEDEPQGPITGSNFRDVTYLLSKTLFEEEGLNKSNGLDHSISSIRESILFLEELETLRDDRATQSLATVRADLGVALYYKTSMAQGDQAKEYLLEAAKLFHAAQEHEPTAKHNFQVAQSDLYKKWGLIFSSSGQISYVTNSDISSAELYKKGLYFRDHPQEDPGYAKAIECFTKATILQERNVMAMRNLVIIYGRLNDPQNAKLWARRAASIDSEISDHNLVKAQKEIEPSSSGTDLPSLSIDQTGTSYNSESESLTKDVSREVNEHIDPTVSYEKGLYYRDHPEEDPGYAKAMGCFLKVIALDDKNVKAMHNLAMIYWKLQDLQNANLWFHKASDLGFEPSKRNLAKMQENPIPQTLEKQSPNLPVNQATTSNSREAESPTRDVLREADDLLFAIREGFTLPLRRKI